MKKRYILWTVTAGVLAWFATQACFPIYQPPRPVQSPLCADQQGNPIPCPSESR